jgi:RNA polymerase sigma-70 factor, ECF subfamily
MWTARGTVDRAAASRAGNRPILDAPMRDSLASAFWQEVQSPARSTIDLEALLGELAATGQAAWPTVALPAVALARHLGTLYDRDLPVDEWLRSVRIGELYLTCACACGLPEAIAELDRRFLAQAVKHIAHLRPSRAFADDVLSELRERLLVAPPGQRPRIAEYAGLGQLDGGWLRVVTTRVALDLLRRCEPAAAGSAVGEQVDARAESPELGFIRSEYRALFQDCLTGAVKALPASERNLLRMHTVDGVTLEQLAQLFRVSRATVVRRLAAARKSVLDVMRTRVLERLTLAAGEFESLFGQLASQLDLSLSTVL